MCGASAVVIPQSLSTQSLFSLNPIRWLVLNTKPKALTRYCTRHFITRSTGGLEPPRNQIDIAGYNLPEKARAITQHQRVNIVPGYHYRLALYPVQHGAPLPARLKKTCCKNALAHPSATQSRRWPRFKQPQSGESDGKPGERNALQFPLGEI